MIYQKIFRPILFKTDPEKIHHLASWGLDICSKSPLFFLFRRLLNVNDSGLNTALGSVKLLNPVGLSAGFDKNISSPLAYSMLGFGFAELGSITAKPCAGNPKPRLWRLPKDKALIVYYGLANIGAVWAAKRLAKINRRYIPYGLNLAPTPSLKIDQMPQDYLESLAALHSFADYIVLNVSCPNVAACAITEQVDFITNLLKTVKAFMNEKNIKKDLWIKIGPDMSAGDLDKVIDACVDNGLTGIVATNLVKNRSGAVFSSSAEELNHPGGVSGKVLQERSDNTIKHIYQRAGEKLKIMAVGGIFTAADAYRKIKLGASALQLITGFIYGGPLTVWRINRGLVKLLKQDGFKNISEAVGKGV